jgi:DNA replication and repair protein RecF
MRIQNISLNNLRCHRQRFFEFSDSINVIFGNNGVGKTTILEAISIASISKSFLPISDSLLVKYGENKYKIDLTTLNHLNLQETLSIEYSLGGRKSITNGYGEKLQPKDIIGAIPTIILSPDLKNITSGAPSARRSFFDGILCQTSKVYLDNLVQYKKCLKNRNNLLLALKKNAFFDESEFEEWTNLLIQYAAEIIWKRINFFNEFLPYFFDEYRKIASDNDSLFAEYKPFSFENLNSICSKHDTLTRLSEIADKYKNIEKFRYQTLFGPHKDELAIYINGGLAKDFASQGQHKSLLIALKLAEYYYIMNNHTEKPIILLDDIFSELDQQRSEKVLHLMDFNRTQVFITITNPQFLNSYKPMQNINLIQIT